MVIGREHKMDIDILNRNRELIGVIQVSDDKIKVKTKDKELKKTILDIPPEIKKKGINKSIDFIVARFYRSSTIILRRRKK